MTCFQKPGRVERDRVVEGGAVGPLEAPAVALAVGARVAEARAHVRQIGAGDDHDTAGARLDERRGLRP